MDMSDGRRKIAQKIFQLDSTWQNRKETVKYMDDEYQESNAYERFIRTSMGRWRTVEKKDSDIKCRAQEDDCKAL